jgi:hypothetical protein
MTSALASSPTLPAALASASAVSPQRLAPSGSRATSRERASPAATLARSGVGGCSGTSSTARRDAASIGSLIRATSSSASSR